MKRLLAFILSLLMLVGVFISCDNETPTETSSQSEGVKESDSEESSRNHEETMTTLDSENESVDISSESESEDGETYPFFEKVVLDGVTVEHFEAYTAYLDKYYFPIGFEGDSIGFIAKAIFTYEDFAKGVVNDAVFETITEQTFEDNFVIITQGIYPVLRTFDIYYTNFKQEDGFYSITFNAVYSRKQGFNEQYDSFVDICVIPKSLCNDTSLTEVKLVYKTYVFEDQNYNSSCEVTTYLPE